MKYIKYTALALLTLILIGHGYITYRLVQRIGLHEAYIIKIVQVIEQAQTKAP